MSNHYLDQSATINTEARSSTSNEIITCWRLGWWLPFFSNKLFLIKVCTLLFLDIILLLSHFSHVRPCATHRRQPTRLPHPWDSPGKNTGVGCHFLLQCMKVKSESQVTQLFPTLCDPMDCSLPGSSVHGILQARILEWVAISFILRESSKFC